jgi:hypothetical protein
MSFSDESFDADTLSSMKRALEEAWTDLRALLIAEPLDAEALRAKLALRITAAARNGERDPKQLKLIALGVMEGDKRTR